jgi:hypothetical protein
MTVAELAKIENLITRATAKFDNELRNLNKNFKDLNDIMATIAKLLNDIKNKIS